MQRTFRRTILVLFSCSLIVSAVGALFAQQKGVAEKKGGTQQKRGVQQSGPEKGEKNSANAVANTVTRQASALEAKLGKYKDTAAEAADVMAQLVDLYHTHGRIFGLLRVGQKFVISHPSDKRHAGVMLKLIDGLEAASRNPAFTGNCRQFLARYPQAPQCPSIEIRLADTLNQMSDRNAAADADRAVFRRQPMTLTGRRHGVRAIRNYTAINKKAVYAKAAGLAMEMLARLPAGQLATDIGNQSVHQWRRGAEWAKSNLAAGLMLKKGIPADPRGQRELHRLMAENFSHLGQYANAIASLKRARRLGDNAALHYQHIYQLHRGMAKSAQMEPVVNDYLRKYPTRQNRFVVQSFLSYAFVREKNLTRAVSLLAALLPYDAVTNSNAINYVGYSKNDKATNAQLARVLTDAIARNPGQANFLRYTLAYYVYRIRIKDTAQTQQTLRDLIALSPGNNGYTSNAVTWLLGDAADDNEFLSNLTIILASARKNLHLPILRTAPAVWAKQNRKNKKLRTRTALVLQQLQKLNRDPLVAAWQQISNVRSRKAAAVRAKLLAPATLKAMNDGMARQLLSLQGSHYWSYGGAKLRSQAALIYARMAKRFPKDYPVAVSYLRTATDYSPAEIRKEAALHMLSLSPPNNSYDVWRRLMIAADSAKEPTLLRRAYRWILASQKKYGKESMYASYIGDILAKYKMETEAIAYWTVYVAYDRNHYESRECASRLLSRMKKEDVQKKIRFVRELFKHDTDFQGRYAEWLAGYEFARGNLDAFEKTLRSARTRQDARLMRGWDFAEYTAQYWINAYRGDKEKSDAEKRRIFTVVRDLRLLRASATAKLSLLEIAPPKSMPEIQRLIAYQSASRMVGNASHDWDRLMPHVQAALTRKDFPAAAVLLTGMLTNISGTETGRKKIGRELVAQSYSRMGGVGLTIDEKSPIAPLLRAALYLRLGDQRLAFEAYTAHRVLFNKHRNQVPVDLLLFVCENHIAAAGDKNHEYVEDMLRGWMVKNSESKAIEDLTKARVQLMLAQNFFKARRYDIARNEFNTVINRYAKTPQAIEARFGIGETFMAQKVYDQAESVFEKLANSRDTDIVVRAEFLRGVLTYRRGDKDEARKIFRSVLEKVPNINLANKALFNLAEVYGSEERYIDQLNLLRTVGRLGRTSKRHHRPGAPLSIVVQDSDLGISRGHNKIPVRVTTLPGGDSELIYLTSGGAGKGLFRADLETRLGQVSKGDNVLQLTGRDVIKCDYPPQFKAEFKHVSLSDVEIRIAANAEFKIASSKIIDEKEESFSEKLRQQANRKERTDQRVSQNRPANQIKPGNFIYLQVKDADRDLTDAADSVVIKLTADSGDQVQLTLKETGPHTGQFEGTAKTDELPAGALASDTAIGHSPLMAIDRDPKTAWVSEPDGETPKSLTIDMKDLKHVARVRMTTPDAKRQAPVRAELQGSDDGRFWFRLASNPPIPQAAPVAANFGRMKIRVYNGNFTGYTTWNQIAKLGTIATPLPGLSKDPVVDLTWARPETAEKRKRPFAVIWHGKLVQDRPGASRILVRGVRTAVAIDGRVQLPVGRGNRTVDVWLEAGTHELTIFSATNQGTQTVSALFARANHATANVTLRPFRKTDFDLKQPAAKQATFPADAANRQPQVTVADRTWEFQFKPINLRYVRFLIHEYRGEAVSIGNVEVVGEEPDSRYIPTQSDVLSLAKNKVLEIAGGDVVTATYADEHTQSDADQSRLLTARLTATYFNANVTPVAYDSLKQDNGLVTDVRKELMRIDPGERIVFEIIDFDNDQTNERDKVRFQVFVNDGDPVTLIATETGNDTGIFTREVDTSAKLVPGKLQVKRGDRIYCRYIDAQNTFPGHAVPREAVVFVNEPSIAQIRLYESRLLAPTKASSTARPRFVFQLPPATREISHIAFEAPLTVEVIDPDAARNSLSTVTVSLRTTEGVKVDVQCVISPAFAPRTQSAIENWPLREGRFIGQLILQLGGRNSPKDVPLSSEMPRNLIGGPLIDGKIRSQFDRSLTTRVLNLTGKSRVSALYSDKLRPDGKTQNIVSRGRLITNGKLTATNRNFEKPVKQLHVGEKLYLQVKDADQDTSDERDTVTVDVSTSEGKEKEQVTLRETLAHSGVFIGSFPLKPNAKPTPHNLNKNLPVIETYFGDTLSLKYLDPAASSDDGTRLVESEIPVVIGTDGLVAAFSKTFNDEKLAVETKFHIAESYFELFKSHKKIGRKSEQEADLKSGRRVLREVIEDYPDPKYVPRITYLLGQFAQELRQWPEAISSYELIVRQYPDHTLAPDAQYKLAQCHEESGDFNQALEAYVTLAATYPQSPLIADVMLRISDHFYKAKKYNVAAQVGEKFQERFHTHKHAAVMSFRVGQCYFKSEKYKQASVAFDNFAKQFPDNKLASSAFFWSGESFRLARNNREAFVRFNNCRWKFPSSEAAKYARGRLSLPEMIQQFEAQAREVENNN